MGTPSVAISGGPVVVRVWCVCGRRALERAEKQDLVGSDDVHRHMRQYSGGR